MKLTIATIAASALLAGAAAAMTVTENAFEDPRSAALGATSAVISGTTLEVPSETVFEPRAKALVSQPNVEISLFDGAAEEPRGYAIR